MDHYARLFGGRIRPRHRSPPPQIHFYHGRQTAVPMREPSTTQPISFTPKAHVAPHHSDNHIPLTVGKTPTRDCQVPATRYPISEYGQQCVKRFQEWCAGKVSPNLYGNSEQGFTIQMPLQDFHLHRVSDALDYIAFLGKRCLQFFYCKVPETKPHWLRALLPPSLSFLNSKVS
ncbi:hypothetical protein HOY82DRAFT_538409 [Tuber indicum]|nr:hypothetical protein HOY82DRAFT_538409 [Tuber indicum]